MPWDASPGAGFTTGSPWLPLSADHTRVNVAALEQDPRSILHLYRRLIALRAELPFLVSGKIEDLAAENDFLRYRRTDVGERVEVLLNLSHQPATVSVEAGTILLSTYLDKQGELVGGALHLRPAEGVILRLH